MNYLDKILSIITGCILGIVLVIFALENKSDEILLVEEETSSMGTYMASETISTTSPPEKIIDCPLDAPFQHWIKDTCDVYGVDFYVIISMIEHESSYNPDAVNESTGCVGYMQIMTYYHQVYKGNEALDMTAPCLNVLKGIELMSSYLDRNDGDYIKALTHYSGGSVYYAESVLNRAEEMRNGC